MPVQLFTEAERARHNRFPETMAYEDLVAFFTLSESDIDSIPRSSAAHNRLGYALQLCALRFMGFVPNDLTSAPPEVVAYVAQQLAVDPTVFAAYGARAHTRQDHLQAAQAHLGYRKMGQDDVEALARWLRERALEHDKPTLLYELTCEKLRAEQLIRPGVTRLERLVAEARQRAQAETFRRLGPLLSDGSTQFLDTLLAPDPDRDITRLAWLRRPALSNSPRAILDNLDKLAFLRTAGVEHWDLAGLNPNRLKLLAQLARKSRAQALQRAPAERRYPILVAFLYQSLVEVTDDVIAMFDRCLADADARAEQDVQEFRIAVARATNEKVYLFRELGRVILDPEIADAALRPTIYQRIPPLVLRRAVEEADRIVRPLDESYFDFLETRYSYLRHFAPPFLETFTFHSNRTPDPLLEAVALLHELNTSQRRSVPDDAPIAFVPLKWRPYVVEQEGRINRHYYALCALWELRGALRGGNVWVQPSRRYANPDTYLIPQDRWPTLRPEVCQQVRAPAEGAVRLAERGQELVEILPRVDRMLARTGTGKVRMENGALVVPRLEAEELPASAEHLQTGLTARLPLVDLPALLIEVDHWTGFSRHLRHLSGREPRQRDFLPVLYAALLAQGCNFGLARMAQMADLAVDRLAWCTTWYLREDTLTAATNALVNFHHQLPLSHRWGGGTLSSSDGQRFPVAGKIRNATALPRYFLSQGLTFYSWTSDQFSQYGTKVIPATIRDATYVLDAILDNETELAIVEHTTDTAGFT
ncbi:MAG: Tn3 family transposase [Deltaproteobacteria bacterium]|nr:Tn3 family transposase [Deltaproteobacteria bacterium]